MRILQPPGWPRPKGYAHGVEARGRLVFVSGAVGWDEHGRFPSGFAAQTRQALSNVLAVLAEAGASPGHVARMTWYVVDKREYLAAGKEVGEIYRTLFGGHYPAMTAVEVAALIEDQARVEIEVTAVVPEDGD